jgi:lipoic acid synthetase
MNPNTTLETLIPEIFKVSKRNIDRVSVHKVVSHNMETVRELTREVRIQAKYDQKQKF